MPASILQEVFADDSFGSGTTLTTPAFASNATIGTTIALFGTCSANSTPPGTLSDSASQVYTLKSTAFDPDAGNQALLMYVLQNNQSTAKLTFHETYGTAQTGKGLWAMELGGVGAISYDNSTARIVVFPGTGVNAVAGDPITPNSPPVLCVCLTMEILNGNGSGLAAGTGFTLGSSGWTFGGGNPLAKSQSKLLVTSTSTASTMTDATNGNSSEYAISMGMFDQTSNSASIAWVV